MMLGLRERTLDKPNTDPGLMALSFRCQKHRSPKKQTIKNQMTNTVRARKMPVKARQSRAEPIPQLGSQGPTGCVRSSLPPLHCAYPAWLLPGPYPLGSANMGTRTPLLPP